MSMLTIIGSVLIAFLIHDVLCGIYYYFRLKQINKKLNKSLEEFKKALKTVDYESDMDQHIH